jgi:hypothetical protein
MGESYSTYHKYNKLKFNEISFSFKILILFMTVYVRMNKEEMTAPSSA